MLRDEDRIFTNLYGMFDRSLAGYRLLGSDGGIFSFPGSLPFFGSVPGTSTATGSTPSATRSSASAPRNCQ